MRNLNPETLRKIYLAGVVAQVIFAFAVALPIGLAYGGFQLYFFVEIVAIAVWASWYAAARRRARLLQQ